MGRFAHCVSGSRIGYRGSGDVGTYPVRAHEPCIVVRIGPCFGEERMPCGKLDEVQWVSILVGVVE